MSLSIVLEVVLLSSLQVSVLKRIIVVGFGFSVGDFVAAAGVIVRVIKAFDSIDGA